MVTFPQRKSYLTPQEPASISDAIGFFILFEPPFAFIYFAPMAAWSSLLYMAVLTAPITIALAVYINNWREKKQKTYKRTFASTIVTTIFLSLFVVAQSFIANVIFDNSMPETKAFEITNKSTLAWGIHTAHFVFFISPYPDPLPFKLGNSEYDSDITWRDYGRIVPNKTQINLKIHQGFLGLPWYESNYLFSESPQ